MAFDRTHPVTQLLCRREAVLTRKQLLPLLIATHFIWTTHEKPCSRIRTLVGSYEKQRAREESQSLSHVSVYICIKKALLDKNAKTIWSAAGVRLPLRCMHEISSLITSLFLCPVTPGRDQTCTTWKHLWSALICFYPLSRVLVAVPEWRSVPAAQHLLLSWRLDGSTLWRA